jgi:alpha-tubulin suppressor-like RCC1 family protein
MPNQFLSPEGDLENYFTTESWLIDQYIGDTLWGWGDNGYGQLGINNTVYKCTPVTTSTGGTNWVQVDNGYIQGITAAIKTDGTLWTWGRNNYGQLGINVAGTTTGRTTPVTTFAGGTNWKQVACNGYYTAAIKTDGTLWTWGRNYSGQLGINVAGATTGRTTPVTTFSGGTNWKQVACGSQHIAAIKTDGTLWVWGLNYRGQVGDNTLTQKNTPVTTFSGGTNWKQVTCGGNSTLAIKTDGTLWVWGQNSYGQLGNNDANNLAGKTTPVTTFAGGTNWKQVSCSGVQTAAIKTDGTLWTWGRNENGTLGINISTIGGRTTPVTTFAGGTNWKQVSCGSGFMAAIKTDGTLWTWGGVLGFNDGNPRSTPVTTYAGGSNWKQVSCGSLETFAVTSGTDPTFFIS